MKSICLEKIKKNYKIIKNNQINKDIKNLQIKIYFFLLIK